MHSKRKLGNGSFKKDFVTMNEPRLGRGGTVGVERNRNDKMEDVPGVRGLLGLSRAQNANAWSGVVPHRRPIRKIRYRRKYGPAISTFDLMRRIQALAVAR